MQEILETRSHDEKTPLLRQQRDERLKARKVEIVPMKRSDMARGANTIHTAFHTDSLMQYFDDADTAPFLERRAKFRYYLMFDAGIRQHRQLTVDAGAAVLKYQVPGGREDPWVHTYLTNVSRKLFDTRELTKRVTEFAEKTVAAVVDAFGEKLAEMYEIQSLGTNPEFQGQGFGSALVTAVTDMADADSRDVWLVTTDAYAFYEFLGFATVRSFIVGDANPTWAKAPITVRVMHRPWKKSIEDV
ncbi:hypothetical protein VTO73DRAFT_3434 [Trametes versicolor]